MCWDNVLYLNKWDKLNLAASYFCRGSSTKTDTETGNKHLLCAAMQCAETYIHTIKEKRGK